MCHFHYECYVLDYKWTQWVSEKIPHNLIILISIYSQIHDLILGDCKIKPRNNKPHLKSSYILTKDKKHWTCTQTNTAGPSWYRICQTASSASIFLSFTIDSIDLWRCGSSPRSKLSRALTQTGKRALSEDTVYSRIEDTVRREGREGKSELEKHSRELEGRRWRRRRRRGLVNGARTCGEKHSARQALKLHSKAAGVKQCQSCETHRTPLAKTQPRVRETRHPNQMLASQTKYTYSRYTVGLRGILPLRSERLFQ